MAKVSAQSAITGANVADGDLFYVVDISDTTDGAGGTGKILTRAELEKALEINEAALLPETKGGTGVSSGNVVSKGNWNASAGSFPGSDLAQTGWLYRVSVAGTVDSQVFAVGDYLIAITDEASATTYTANWQAIRNIDTAEITKLGYITVTGAVDLDALGTAALVDTGTDPADVPLNSDLGTAAYLDTGTGAGEVVVNGAPASFGDLTAEYLEISANLARVDLYDTSSTSGQRRESIYVNNEEFLIVTRSDAGSFVSRDYAMDKGSSGVTNHRWFIGGNEAAKIDALGKLLIGKSTSGIGTVGVENLPSGIGLFTADGSQCIDLNRLSSDGTLMRFLQAGTGEGSITVSGTTVSYNGAHLSRYSQWEGSKVTDTEEQGRPEVLRGTILSNVDEMCEWFAVEWEQVIPAEFDEVTHYKTKPIKKPKVSYEIVDDKAVRVLEEVTIHEIQTEKFPIFENGKPVTEPQKIPVMEKGKQKIDDDGEPVFISKQVQKFITRKIVDRVEKVEIKPEKTVKHHELYDGAGKVGDVIDYTTESGEVVKAAIVKEDNEQLNRTVISSVAGDKSVAGVFQDYDLEDDTAPYDFSCAMTGDFVVRISKDVDCKDLKDALIVSNGDGTGVPQSDDIVRASTVAKVTSTEITETYKDGSYIVPCVLMAC